jgi:2-methylisocitrate lyase-like PEP mutase family enzyme
MASVSEKRAAFHALHKSGCFVIPNPWDIGSARYLQGMGFKALASTSSGFAWSKGFADNHVTRELVLTHLSELVAATDVPINADFEGGFAHDPAGIAESVKLAVKTGVAGLSIEDSTGDKEKPLYDIDIAVARL